MDTRKKQFAVVLCFLAAMCPCAFALNPSLDISQYAHTAWTIRDGFFKGFVSSIAQTPDGYLWLGTEFGLLRFDGVRPVEFVPPASDRLPHSRITTLFTGSDGRLWIGTRAGLASWNGTKLTRYPEFDGKIVLAVLEDHEGTVWVGGSRLPDLTGWLCGIRGGKTDCYGQDDSVFGAVVTSLYEDSEQRLWVGAANGLWVWKPGAPKRYPVPDSAPDRVLEGDDRQLLVGTPRGVMQFVNEQVLPYRIAGVSMPRRASRLFRDRDGSLWIGTTGQGLFHLHRGRTDLFSRVNGLSGDEIYSILEDREGNVWVSTSQGLDRFRELPVVTVSDSQGLATDVVLSVLAAKDGSVWLAGRNGLNRLKGGQVMKFGKANGLPEDDAQSLAESDDGQIWVSSRRGLARFDHNQFFPAAAVPDGEVAMAADAQDIWVLSFSQGLRRLKDARVIEDYPWARLKHRPQVSVIAADPQHGGLWLGFRQEGGVAYFKDGEVRASYGRADGLGEGGIFDLQLDRDGSLWAATESGLSLIRQGRGITLTSKNGLPCDTVYWKIEADDHSNWLYMPCGLVRIAPGELEAWANGAKRDLTTTVFTGADGVRSQSIFPSYTPLVSKDTDGKIWFVSADGISVVDPRHLSANNLQPPVHIEHIVADDQPYDASQGLPLPPSVRNLEIDYTALSLAAPEKVQFRYKLENYNNSWHDAGNRRQAFFTHVPPGHYRFRVIASNNSGVWNEQGASLDFSIEPAYYQTRWFLASSVIAFAGFLYGVYRLRLYQIAREFNSGLEARVNERTRIARDLHDTLLQSFHGLLLRFQTAYDLLPPNANEAREHLEKAIDQSIQAVTEGREAVQALRTSAVESNDLAVAIKSIGKEVEFGSHHRNVPGYQVEVKGKPRNLHPILRDETYKIAVEAVRNAFQHAEARKIEVEIRYEEKQFSVHIRDDGKGIDPEVQSEGRREGHFGLHGMKERATIAGGKLAIWSEPGGGTEIELTIPASTAYRRHAGSPASRTIE